MSLARVFADPPSTENLLLAGVVLAVMALLSAPGLLAYHKYFSAPDEELLELQVQKNGDEVMRLQILVDKQAVEIAKLQVEVANLQLKFESMATTAIQLADQIVADGKEPIVNPRRLAAILRTKGTE